MRFLGDWSRHFLFAGRCSHAPLFPLSTPTPHARTGLVEWYGAHQRLRELVNLVVVGGVIDPEQTHDREEQDQCRLMHTLLEKYGLQHNVRWIVAQKNRVKCVGR